MRERLRGPAWALLMVLLAFSLGLLRLTQQSVWWDEGHSIQMAAAPLNQIATQPGMDVHPPGFFAALHLWMALAGESTFALRFFSLGWMVLLVAMLLRFGRHLGGRRAGYWTALLAAVSPLYLTYAQEVRMYAMLTFLATAGTYFLWRILYTGPVRRLDVAAYVLFTTATLYTHYFTIFLLAAHNLLWLWSVWQTHTQPGRQLRLWWGTQAAILLLFSPQLRLALRQVGDYANPNLQPPTWLEFVARSGQAYTLGQNIDSGIALPAAAMLGLLLVWGLWRYARRPAHWAIVVWLLVPLVLYFAALQLRPSFEPRYLLLATPPLFLGLGYLAGRADRTRWLTGPLSLALLLLGTQSYFSNEAFFKDDARAVADWLAAETTASDIVLVDVPHPFHHYADQIPAPTHYFFVDVHTAADRLNELALGREHLFWITWAGSDTDPRGVVDYLLQKQAGPPQLETGFPGYRLRAYRLGQTPFALPTDLAPIEVNFDNRLMLTGLTYSRNLEPGQAAWATLRFRQLVPMERNFKVSLRLSAPDGTRLAQDDRLLLNDRHFQTAAWPIDDPALNQAINVYLLPLNDPAYQGPASLEVVVYNAANNAAIAAYGVPTRNDDFVSAQVGRVQIGPE